MRCPPLRVRSACVCRLSAAWLCMSGVPDSAVCSEVNKLLLCEPLCALLLLGCGLGVSVCCVAVSRESVSFRTCPACWCRPPWCACCSAPVPGHVNQSPVDRLRLRLAGEELPLNLKGVALGCP